MSRSHGLVPGYYCRPEGGLVEDPDTKLSKRERQDLYNVLARYMTVNGKPPPKATNKYIFPYFNCVLKPRVHKSKRTDFLMQLASFLRANEHKEVDIYSFKYKP